FPYTTLFRSLDAELAEVHDELQVERRHGDAGLALAARPAGNTVALAGEAEVRALQRLEQVVAERRGGGQVDVDRVAFQLDQLDRRVAAVDDRLDQLRQDVLGVIQLRAGQVGGVARDVGDDQVALARAVVRHRSPRVECRALGRPGLPPASRFCTLGALVDALVSALLSALVSALYAGAG